jgi:GH15 family glucan-1,4-alpha-glucosidase
MSERYPPIESYAVIGDLQSVALVGSDASIDFLCLPRFDSPSIFAALLDADRGGRFSITPRLDGARCKQLYLPETNVLLSRFLAPEGVAEITDLMVVGDQPMPSRMVRRAKAVRGTIELSVRCVPRFDYARAQHRVEHHDDGVRFSQQGGDMVLRLASSHPLSIEDGDAVARVTLREGESVWWILEQLTEEAPPSPADDAYVRAAFKDTVNYWRRWIGTSSYSGRWRDAVNRSALTLKLLHSRRYGAIVAAPTLGLPEVIGGDRNWDYRYTWVRDASFTLYALIRLGMTAETKAFVAWLTDRAGLRGDPSKLQTLYAIDGRTDLAESTLDHLEGYRGSRPVRIGNDAHAQLQLDIYGELMDALYLYDEHGEATSYDLWMEMRALVEWVRVHWQEPDEGVWEGRSGRREHLYSRVMCWVAIDRGMRLAIKRSLPAPIGAWRETRDAIYHDVFTNFWDAEEKTFVAAKGTRELDAACLIMPLVRFIGATDERWLSTLRAVERRLVSDSLVHRHDRDSARNDGISPSEGTFSICSFWYAECLSRAGDLQQARLVLEKMLGYANHVGLFSEQLGLAGEHLGNFPQAFTHLALISAAYDLNRRLDAEGWEDR